jgi:hypothetical protein
MPRDDAPDRKARGVSSHPHDTTAGWLGRERQRRVDEWFGSDSIADSQLRYETEQGIDAVGQQNQWEAEAAEVGTYADGIEAVPTDPLATALVCSMVAYEAAGKVVWNNWHNTWEKPRPAPTYDPNRRLLSESELLDRFDLVRRDRRGWTARCPSHQDRSPSLSIRQGDRWWLLHCFAGCTSRAVTEAVGLRVSDMWLGGDDG